MQDLTNLCQSVICSVHCLHIKFGETSLGFNLIPMFLWIKLRGMMSETADKSTQESLNWQQSRHSRGDPDRPLLIKWWFCFSGFITNHTDW